MVAATVGFLPEARWFKVYSLIKGVLGSLGRFRVQGSGMGGAEGRTGK